MALRYASAFVFMALFGLLGVLIMTGELPEQIGNSKDSKVLLGALKDAVENIGATKAGIYALAAALIIPLFILSRKRGEA